MYMYPLMAGVEGRSCEMSIRGRGIDDGGHVKPERKRNGMVVGNTAMKIWTGFFKNVPRIDPAHGTAIMKGSRNIHASAKAAGAGRS